MPPKSCQGAGFSLDREEEGGLGLGTGAGKTEFGSPLADDLRGDIGTILAGSGGAQDFGNAVGDGSGRLQPEFKLDIAHVHQFAGGIAEFDEDVVGGGSQAAFRGEQIGRQIGDGRAGEGRAREDMNGRRFGAVPNQRGDNAKHHQDGHQIEQFEERFHASLGLMRAPRTAPIFEERGSKTS